MRPVICFRVVVSLGHIFLPFALRLCKPNAATLTPVSRQRGGRPVRRQGFWNRRPSDLREHLAHLVCDVRQLVFGEASVDLRWFCVILSRSSRTVCPRPK